jgi:hypothetical protein
MWLNGEGWVGPRLSTTALQKVKSHAPKDPPFVQPVA